MSPEDAAHAVHLELRGALADPGLRGEALCSAVFALGTRHRVEPFRCLVRDLLALDLPEPRARTAFLEIETHRARLESVLGRDPGFVVAALDHLRGGEGLPGGPVIRQGGTAAADGSGPGAPAGMDEERGRLERHRADRSRRPVAWVALAPDPPSDGAEQGGPDLLRHVTRDSDWVRGAGDVLTVLLPCTDAAAARRAAERYRIALVDATGVSWSGGVAGRAPGETPVPVRELEEGAREALRRARCDGGGRVEVARSERRAHARVRPPGGMTASLEHAGRRAEARVEDVSFGGALLATQDVLPRGAAIRLALRGSAVRSRVMVLGSRVVRSGRPVAGGGSVAAVSFLPQPGARGRLADLVADLPGAGPAGRPAAVPGDRS
ncbi:MAG: PilZ domain-containing protein [Candidatus Polarisedimenticolia bacterium]